MKNSNYSSETIIWKNKEASKAARFERNSEESSATPNQTHKIFPQSNMKQLTNSTNSPTNYQNSKPAYLLVVPIKHLRRIHSRPERQNPNPRCTRKLIWTSPNPQETFKSDAVRRETEAKRRTQRASTARRDRRRGRRVEREGEEAWGGFQRTERSGCHVGGVMVRIFWMVGKCGDTCTGAYLKLWWGSQDLKLQCDWVQVISLGFNPLHRLKPIPPSNFFISPLIFKPHQPSFSTVQWNPI